MDYTDYTYLWPPRPETKITKALLGFYQQREWYAQKKKNGTCTVIFAKGNKVIFKTRHNDDHKLWTPKDDHIKFFQGREQWNVYVAELLHSKVTGGPRDELYIFDQLVSDGQFLRGTTFNERYQALKARFGGESEDDQFRIAKRITLAKCFKSGFVKMFDNLKKEDEGLVLKDPNAQLQTCMKQTDNAGWQVKCRIAQANYSF